MRQRELLRQFVFEGAVTVPLEDWQRRNRGFHDQKLPPPPPDVFSRLWLDNHIGMSKLPAEMPRIPIAIEAHFSRDIWNKTGGASYTAHHTGLSINLPSPGAMFPAPAPETWVKDLGDRLAAMQQVGWKEKMEIRTARVKKEMREQLVGPQVTEAQFEEIWGWRQHAQRFFGQVSSSSPFAYSPLSHFSPSLYSYPRLNSRRSHPLRAKSTSAMAHALTTRR